MMFRLYAGIALALFLGLAVWAGYTFYTDTQDRIQTLSQQNAELTIALNQEREIVRKMRVFQESQNRLSQELNEALLEAESPLQELERTFSENNFKKLASEQPALIEERINIATDQLFKEIECVTGNCSE